MLTQSIRSKPNTKISQRYSPLIKSGLALSSKSALPRVPKRKPSQQQTTSLHTISVFFISASLILLPARVLNLSIRFSAFSLRMRFSLPFDSPATILSDFGRAWAAGDVYGFMDWSRSSRMKTPNSDEALSSMTGDFDARGEICPAQFQV